MGSSTISNGLLSRLRKLRRRSRFSAKGRWFSSWVLGWDVGKSVGMGVGRGVWAGRGQWVDVGQVLNFQVGAGGLAGGVLAKMGAESRRHTGSGCRWWEWRRARLAPAGRRWAVGRF